MNSYQKYLKSEFIELGLDQVKTSKLTVLIGVNADIADSLETLNIFTVYDLAFSNIFLNAFNISFEGQNSQNYFKYGIIPSDVIDGMFRSENLENIKFEDIQILEGIGENNAISIKKHLNINSIYDLANWPQYLAARDIVGVPIGHSTIHQDEIPTELVPAFNEYAVEKSYYSIFTVNADNDSTGNNLVNSPTIDKLLNQEDIVQEKIQTGCILKYEQLWTPVGLGLGNLLHSLALAPGESTRIAVIDWKRVQSSKTAEDISQLETLINTMAQNRSINEITNAIAYEAQNGFSGIESETDIKNQAISKFGIQNPEETLNAAISGAIIGGSTGAIAGGLAGAGIGGAITLPEGGFGAIPGFFIGAGSGAIIGGTGGGVGAALMTADFKASQNNDSPLNTVKVKTTTESTGTREVVSEILQNIMDRTHQHSSTSRSRKASIVQEISQSENEEISTRVVTNYNHMHALTIQYFEVVQIYRVTTKFYNSQDILVVPFEPVKNWTITLLHQFRNEILQSVLHPSIIYLFNFAENIVVLQLPKTHDNIIFDVSSSSKNKAIERLEHARVVTGTRISEDLFNFWTLPKNLYIRQVFGTMNNGDGPWGANERHTFNFRLAVTTFDGRSLDLFDPNLEDVNRILRNIKSIQYELWNTDSSWDMETELAQLSNSVYSIDFVFTKKMSDNWENENESFRFSARYNLKRDYIHNNRLIIPILDIVSTPTYEEVIEHLNLNTEFYSNQILKRKNKNLISILLNNYDFNGTKLGNQVDPDPIAISGNKLIFKFNKSINDHSKATFSEKILKSDFVPIQTGGVFAEGIQGRANTAEKLNIERFWNWQDSPIPIVAPEISAIQSGTRAISTDIRPGGLDASTISYMTPTSLPVPGSGTAAVLNAISSDMFRDMSGVLQTAQLAQRALEQAQQGATQAGEQSSESLKNGIDLTKNVVGKIIKMNSDFATLLASTGFASLPQGSTTIPSATNNQRQQEESGGASSTPMTDPRTNISNTGAALNAMEDADKKHLMSVPGISDDTSLEVGLPGGGGDVSEYQSGSGSLHEEGLSTLIGKPTVTRSTSQVQTDQTGDSEEDYLSEKCLLTIHEDEIEWISNDEDEKIYYWTAEGGYTRRKFLAIVYHTLRELHPQNFATLNQHINAQYYYELVEEGLITEDDSSYTRPLTEDDSYLMKARWFKWRDEILSCFLSLPGDLSSTRARIQKGKETALTNVSQVPVKWNDKAIQYYRSIEIENTDNWTRKKRFLYNIAKNNETWQKFRVSWNNANNFPPEPEYIQSGNRILYPKPQPLHVYVTGPAGQVWEDCTHLWNIALVYYKRWPLAMADSQAPMPDWMQIGFEGVSDIPG